MLLFVTANNTSPKVMEFKGRIRSYVPPFSYLLVRFFSGVSKCLNKYFLSALSL